LENGNTFSISSINNSDKNYFIQSTTLNSENYSPNFINYGAIQNGGELIFEMVDKPNKKWGSQLVETPYSLSRQELNRQH
jgi:putative alpha-1,2-mannosidase